MSSSCWGESITTFFPSLLLPRLEDLEGLSLGTGWISTWISFYVLVGVSGGIVCGKNKIFAGQKRQSQWRQQRAEFTQAQRYLCDPSVGEKVESELKQLKIS